MAEPRIAGALVIADGGRSGSVPLTETVPAPLRVVAGLTVIDRVLDRIAAHGIGAATVVVERHRTAIAAHLAHRRAPRVAAVPQPDGPGSGGTIRAALSRIDAAPVLVAGADAFWLDGATPALDRLAAAWDDARMDALILAHAAVRAVGYDGPGELFVDPVGRARLRRGHEVAPYVATGVQLLHPRLLAGMRDGAFAIEAAWARAAEAGRLHALVHDGAWFTLGADAGAAAVADAEEALVELGVWRRPAAGARPVDR